MKWTKSVLRISAGIGAAGIAIASMSACAQTPAANGDTVDYPKRSIELVVPFSAGGATDLLARAYASELEGALGATVVVVNRPGASTSVAATEVANARPDGYTLLLATTTTFSTTPLVQDVAYNPQDFTGLAGLADQPFVIVSGPDSGIESGEDLLDLNVPVTYGVDAVGNNAQLSVANLLSTLGLKGEYVPFSSSQETLTAVMGGHVLLAPADPNVASSQIASGNVKPIAVTSEERLENYPEAPTTAELTDGAAQSFMGRYALVAPAGIDEDVLAVLTGAAEKAATSKGFNAYLEEKGLLPSGYADGEAWLTEMIPADQAAAKEALTELGLIQ